MKPYLIFDMDGVLVDVTDSYRETIRRTVEHFTGAPLARETVQEYKNQGGWNDDWRLSHRIIVDRGAKVEFGSVVDYFQSVFLGNGADGLILRERWIAREGLLERLQAACRLAVLTGRPCEEARITLERFAPLVAFSPLVGMESVTRHKPHPEGLLRIVEAAPGCQAWYVGDTVDDARCARAAGVPFIGVAAGRGELEDILRAEGAIAVLDDINGLEAALRL